MSLSTPLGWQFRGNCNGIDPELFFPFPTETGQIADAKAVCDGCPVREQCLAYAISLDIRHGVWGGLSEAERRELDTRPRRAGNAIESWQVDHGTAGGAQWHRRNHEPMCIPCSLADRARRAKGWAQWNQERKAETVA